MKKKIGSAKLKRYELAGQVSDDMDKGKKRKQYSNVEKSIGRINKAIQNNQPESNKNIKPLSTENKSVAWGAGSPLVNYNINTYKKPVTNDKDSLKAYNSTEALRKTANDYSGGYKNGGSVKMKKGGISKSSKQQAAIGMAMKAAGKKPKKMAMGGSLKDVDASKNPGLAKLPTEVRNKMGYKKYGGSTKMKMGGSCGTPKSLSKKK